MDKTGASASAINAANNMNAQAQSGLTGAASQANIAKITSQQQAGNMLDQARGMSGNPAAAMAMMNKIGQQMGQNNMAALGAANDAIAKANNVAVNASGQASSLLDESAKTKIAASEVDGKTMPALVFGAVSKWKSDRIEGVDQGLDISIPKTSALLEIDELLHGLARNVKSESHPSGAHVKAFVLSRRKDPYDAVKRVAAHCCAQGKRDAIRENLPLSWDPRDNTGSVGLLAVAETEPLICRWAVL